MNETQTDIQKYKMVLADEQEYRTKWKELNLHVLQSYEWGQVKSENYIPQYLMIQANESENIFPVLCLEKKDGAGLVKTAYIPKLNAALCEREALFKVLEDYLKSKYDLVFLEFDLQPDQLPAYLDKLKTWKWQIQPAQSDIIVLGKSEEELWQQLKSGYRRNIKKAERHGVTVDSYTQGEQAVTEFNKIITDLQQTTTFVTHSEKYFLLLWEQMHKRGLAEIYIARQKQDLLGAYLVLMDNLGAYEVYGGVNSKGRSLEAGYILKWKAILAAKQRNKFFYDHWGVAKKFTDGNYDKESELYNISLFKSGFGGEYIEFAPVKIIHSSEFKYQLVLWAQRLNQARIAITKKLRRKN